jgi:hypothetical protein
MDSLGNPLITRPNHTGWEFAFEPYPSLQFSFIDNPESQFGNSSVWTRSETWGECPEPLRTLRLWMWRHVRTQHWSCSRMPTDYGNLHETGSKHQNTWITGHCSQLKMNAPLWSMSWMYWGHYDIGPSGSPRGIQSNCASSWQYSISCSIRWKGWCELVEERTTNERKTCSTLWS